MSLGQKVFVIHGRDKRARREFFTFLRAIGLKPMEWSTVLAEARGGAPLISDVLDKAITGDRAFVVLLTPDDVVQLKPEHADGADDSELRPSGQARPNVLFEAGMAFGRHPEHIVLVEFGKVRPFTDISGRFVVQLDDTTESRHKLANMLRTIGCDVDTSGSDWHGAGDLTPPGVSPVPRSPANARADASAPPPEPLATGAARPEFTSDAGTWKVELNNFAVMSRRRRLVVHGEVVNNESAALTLSLKATFYNVDRRILGSATGLVSQIRSGERRAFELTTMEEFETYTLVHVFIDHGFDM